MLKKFLESLSLLMVLNLLVKPFWPLGIERGVIQAVGLEEYGSYSALFSLTFLFGIVLDLGINNYVNRQIAQGSTTPGTALTAFLPIKIVFSFLYVCCTLVTGFLLGYGSQVGLLTILCLNQALLSFVLYFRANLAGLQLYNKDSITSVLDRSIAIVLCSILLWAFNGSFFTLEAFAWAQTASLSATCGFAIYHLREHLALSIPKPQWTSFVSLLKETYPFAILATLMAIYNRVDILMLEQLLPKEVSAHHAGDYRASYRLLEAANMFAFLFATLLLPMFSRLQNKASELRPLVNLAGSLLLLPAFLACTGIALYADELSQLLTPERSDQSGLIFAILTLSYLPIASIYIYGTLLTAHNKLRVLNMSSALGVGLNVVLNFWLIPSHQAVGAAIATICTQAIVAGIQMALGIKLLQVKPSFSWIARLTGWLSGLFICLYLLNCLDLHWILGLGSLLAINLTFALLLRLIDIKQIFNILKSSA